MKVFFMIICAIGLLPLALFITFCIERLIDNIRREKYPEYFKFYDAAMKICFEASAKVNKEAEYIEHQFNILRSGLAEGECTEAYFKTRFDQLADMHIETTNWFKERRDEAEKLFRQADFYAKENNLVWGVLY